MSNLIVFQRRKIKKKIYDVWQVKKYNNTKKVCDVWQVQNTKSKKNCSSTKTSSVL